MFLKSVGSFGSGGFDMKWFLYILMVGPDGYVVDYGLLASAETHEKCKYAGRIITDRLDVITNKEIVTRFTCIELDKKVERLIKGEPV